MRNTTRYYYIGNKEAEVRRRCGVITVATTVQPDMKTLKVGFAFCSARDQFCKRIGRKIAEGRMIFETQFTGHSAEDVKRFFNIEMPRPYKPQKVKDTLMASLPDYGLTLLWKE